MVRPFVGLGVILGVFELVNPWSEDVPYDDLVGVLQQQAGGLFKARLDHEQQEERQAILNGVTGSVA